MKKIFNDIKKEQEEFDSKRYYSTYEHLEDSGEYRRYTSLSVSWLDEVLGSILSFMIWIGLILLLVITATFGETAGTYFALFGIITFIGTYAIGEFYFSDKMERRR